MPGLEEGHNFLDVLGARTIWKRPCKNGWTAEGTLGLKVRHDSSNRERTHLKATVLSACS